MDNNNSSLNDLQNGKDSLSIIEEFYKYLFFWKYFLISIIGCLFIAFLLNRYTPKVYNTNAKIQILDKKQNKKNQKQTRTCQTRPKQKKTCQNLPNHTH